MNDFLGDDYDEQGNQNNQQSSGSALRKQLEEALQKNKDKDQEIDSLKAFKRERNVADVLSDKNVPAKVAKLIPSDVEATEEGVSKWLNDWSDVFGIQQEGQTEENSQQQNNQPPQGMSEQDVAAQQQMSQVQSGASTAGTTHEQVMSRLMDPNLTEGQLNEMIDNAKHGKAM